MGGIMVQHLNREGGVLCARVTRISKFDFSIRQEDLQLTLDARVRSSSMHPPHFILHTAHIRT